VARVSVQVSKEVLVSSIRSALSVRSAPSLAPTTVMELESALHRFMTANPPLATTYSLADLSSKVVKSE